MSKIATFAFTAVTAFATFCWAQQSSSVSSQNSPSQSSQAASNTGQPSSQSTLPALKVKTRMVVVDVVARDAKGRPVTDLKQDDFTILEEGKEQKVRIFNFQQP